MTGFTVHLCFASDEAGSCIWTSSNAPNIGSGILRALSTLSTTLEVQFFTTPPEFPEHEN